jgi:hypothetical protein
MKRGLRLNAAVAGAAAGTVADAAVAAVGVEATVVAADAAGIAATEAIAGTAGNLSGFQEAALKSSRRRGTTSQKVLRGSCVRVALRSRVG